MQDNSHLRLIEWSFFVPFDKQKNWIQTSMQSSSPPAAPLPPPARSLPVFSCVALFSILNVKRLRFPCKPSSVVSTLPSQAAVKLYCVLFVRWILPYTVWQRALLLYIPWVNASYQIKKLALAKNNNWECESVKIFWVDKHIYLRGTLTSSRLM